MTARNALEPLGWTVEPLDTSRPNPAHLDSPDDSPRRDDGERGRERRG